MTASAHCLPVFMAVKHSIAAMWKMSFNFVELTCNINTVIVRFMALQLLGKFDMFLVVEVRMLFPFKIITVFHFS
jgi:hypothetical protein